MKPNRKNESLISHQLIDERFFYDRDRGRLINRISKRETVALNRGYRVVNIMTEAGRIQFKEHRLIFYYENGYFPESIDHINRDKTDNRIENLRESTLHEQAMNRDITDYQPKWFTLPDGRRARTEYGYEHFKEKESPEHRERRLQYHREYNMRKKTNDT